MTPERFRAVVDRYPRLRIAVVGDFFLDRYLEIDPDREEVSIETGLPVHVVSGVRSQPGAAGTILNNLVALGVGEIFAVGFSGDDGEGFELRRALTTQPGVRMDHFVTAPDRRTPTYCKPLVVRSGEPPRELNRLDTKNWTPTPESLRLNLAARLAALAGGVDAVLLMDQVDRPGSGVVTPTVADAAHALLRDGGVPVVLADSRRGLRDFPPLAYKMNAAELALLVGASTDDAREQVEAFAAEVAARNGRAVFVTMAERGIVGAMPGGPPEHIPSHPVRGPIDIVGAGDSVTANLAAALAAGAGAREAMELAMAAASLVIHQLGTTGTADVAGIAELLGFGRSVGETLGSPSDSPD